MDLYGKVILTVAVIALVVFLIASIAEELEERDTQWNRYTRNWTNIPYYKDNHIRKNKKIDFKLEEENETEKK